MATAIGAVTPTLLGMCVCANFFLPWANNILSVKTDKQINKVTGSSDSPAATTNVCCNKLCLLKIYAHVRMFAHICMQLRPFVTECVCSGPILIPS